MDSNINGSPTVYAMDRRWVFLAGMLIFLAGVVHLVIAPDHYVHAPAHALVFVVSGIAEIVWGLAFWRKPTKQMLVLGVGLAVCLIALWAITRVLPAPFTDVPEEIDLGGIADKALEVAGVVFMILAAFSSLDKHRAWRLVINTAVIAVLVAVLAYQVGFLAEPLFPFLRAPAGESTPAEQVH